MSGYSRTHLFIFGAAVVLFVSAVIPVFFSKPKPSVVPSQGRPPSPFHKNPTFKEKAAAQTSTKEKGWAASLVPFYSIGVFAYVLYIMYKIARKKPMPATSSKLAPPLVKSKFNKRGGNQRTKITAYELNQLEQKLTESEKAVERILKTANKVITEVYQQEMEADESDSQLSSDTSLSEDLPTVKLQKEYDSATSEFSADEKANAYNAEDEYETYSDSEESDLSSCGSNIEDTQVGYKNEPTHNNVTEENPAEHPMSVEEVPIKTSRSNKKMNSNLADVGQKTSDEVEENKKLLETTKEVLKAMGEIRTYMKEHK